MAAHSFSPQALSWLTGDRARVLVLGTHPALVDLLVQRGHDVIAVAPRAKDLAAVRPDATRIVAEPGRLPFQPCSIEAAILPQNLHTLDPGTVLAQVARALVPGGHISLTYMTRDDSVPWVRRLAAIVQAVDPTAMRGDYGTESVDHFAMRRYFPDTETTGFRTWVPVTRDRLLTMVGSRPAIATLPPREVTALLREVGALFDSVARAPEPLSLPYQLSCWRAEVQHAELSAPLHLTEGLRILS